MQVTMFPRSLAIDTGTGMNVFEAGMTPLGPLLAGDNRMQQPVQWTECVSFPEATLKTDSRERNGTGTGPTFEDDGTRSPTCSRLEAALPRAHVPLAAQACFAPSRAGTCFPGWAGAA